MGISEEKMKIVINNYFKSECNVNTSIREAFEKGFRIGVKKGLAQSKTDTPQTDYPCNTCANKGDRDGKCRNCIAESEAFRWKTPSNYEPQTGLSTKNLLKG